VVQGDSVNSDWITIECTQERPENPVDKEAVT
jgi:hypothetical protein